MNQEILIRSEKNAEKIYKINLKGLTCTCPSYFWRSQHNPLFLCKHLKKETNFDRKPLLLLTEEEKEKNNEN